MIYCFLSRLVVVSWRWLSWLKAAERSLGRPSFLLRVLPLAASVVITFVFVVPSFQLIRAPLHDEGMGTVPFALGIAALLLIACGCYRVITAQTRSSRIVARWIEGSQPLGATAGTFAFRSRREAPPLTLVGMRGARVCSFPTRPSSCLRRMSWRSHCRHELAHIRSYDNLKKPGFPFCPFAA